MFPRLQHSGSDTKTSHEGGRAVVTLFCALARATTLSQCCYSLHSQISEQETAETASLRCYDRASPGVFLPSPLSQPLVFITIDTWQPTFRSTASGPWRRQEGRRQILSSLCSATRPWCQHVQTRLMLRPFKTRGGEKNIERQINCELHHRTSPRPLPEQCHLQGWQREPLCLVVEEALLILCLGLLSLHAYAASLRILFLGWTRAHRRCSVSACLSASLPACLSAHLSTHHSASWPHLVEAIRLDSKSCPKAPILPAET